MSAPAGSPDASRYWIRRAQRLAWRVNAAAWWDHWVTPALLTSALAAAGLLLGRRQEIAPSRFLLPLAALWLLAALVALRRARPRFFSTASALVELDVALGLKARLTAAHAGIGAWPPAPERASPVLRWRVSRLLVPPAFAAMMLLVAGFIPVSKARPAAAGPVDPPAAWQQMEDWLKGLREEELAAPEALETWEERLDRLRRQPESVWYAHPSLEAGDTLHQQMEAGLRSMSQDLDETADALETMESVGGAGQPSQAAEADRRLERALQRLEAGPVAMHPRLMSQLKAAQGGAGRSLSMAELEKLRRRLRESAGFCRLQIRECRSGHKDCAGGACLGRRGKGGKGSRAGRGGVGRGPGEAPLMLSDDLSKTDSSRLEGVSNEDLQHAALGDVIGRSRTGHRIDTNARVAPMAGGRVNAAPAGGEAVWRDALTPEEQRVLQRYFK